jgi:hypothetical protein
VDDDGLDAIIAIVRQHYDDHRVPVGEHVGIIAGQSFGEALGQATLRTFHYAGLKAKPPDDEFSSLLGIRKSPYYMAVALHPDIAFSREEVEKVVKGLKKARLGDSVSFDIGTDRYLAASLESDEDEWRVACREGLEMGHILCRSRPVRRLPDTTMTDELGFNEMRHLIGEMVTKWGDPRSDPENFPGLRSKMVLTLKVVDGEECLLLEAPHLGSRLVLDLIERCQDLEYCRGCLGPLSLMKFMSIGSPKQRDRAGDSIEAVSAEDYRERIGEASIEEARDVLKGSGLIANPLSESADFGSPDWVLGVRRKWKKEPSYYRWGVQRARGMPICPRCGLGWSIDQAIIHVAGASADYEVDALWESGEDLERDMVEIGGPWNLGLDLGGIGYGRREGFRTPSYAGGRPSRLVHRRSRGGSSDADLGTEVVFGPEQAGGMAYPGATRHGAATDYPVAYMHEGATINEAKEGEHYIVVIGRTGGGGGASPPVPACGELTRPPGRFKGVGTKMLKTKQRGAFVGYFALLDGDERFDFLRSTCDCPVQVFHTLGIEACRTVWLHNLYGTLSRGPEVFGTRKSVIAGENDMSFKHYLMIVDNSCRGVVPKHIRGGDSTVSGAAAAKGSISIPKNGGMEHYADVLGIAAGERQLEVLLYFAKTGVTDPLSSWRAQQIAGQVSKSVELTPKNSRYEVREQMGRMQEVKSEMVRIIEDINALTDEAEGLHLYGQFGHDNPTFFFGDELEKRQEIYEMLLAVPGVSDLQEQYAALIGEFEDLHGVFGIDEPKEVGLRKGVVEVEATPKLSPRGVPGEPVGGWAPGSWPLRFKGSRSR